MTYPLHRPRRFECAPNDDSKHLLNYRPTVKLLGPSYMLLPMSDDPRKVFTDPGATCVPPARRFSPNATKPQLIVAVRGPHIDLEWPAIAHLRYTCYIAGGGIPSLEMVRTVHIGKESFKPCESVALTRPSPYANNVCHVVEAMPDFLLFPSSLLLLWLFVSFTATPPFAR